MSDLKLIALDAEDLQVISAHLQDAVLRVRDMTYLVREKRFAALTNRFDWVKAIVGAQTDASGRERQKNSLQRRRTALRFERVLSAKVQGVDLKDQRATLSLLAVTFTPSGNSDGPDGDVTLTFSGGAAIRLTVECVEAEMKDLGAAWAAKHSPDHTSDAEAAGDNASKADKTT